MLIGQSPQIQAVRKLIREIAKTDENTLIIGDVGVGKKLAAREIHRRSRQKNRPFVILNCTAIGDTIMDADLFGEKTDAPGAVERKLGLVEQANRGILYMENIDELNPEYQLKFTSMFKENKFRKSGEEAFVAIDIRVIASTTNERINEKEDFRKDLLSILTPFIMNIPPLKKRKQDIPLLFNHFLEEYCGASGRGIPPVPTEIFDSIMAYDWNVNVLELQNTVRNLVLMSPEGRLSIEYLPFEIKKHPFEFLEGRDLNDAVAEVERYLIGRTLRKFAGNQTKAAKALNISEAALRYKMKKFGLSKKIY